MEEERIKSAFELAMERISGLPQLTPEEKAEQKEKEFSPLGTAIAVRYMAGTLSDTELPDAVSRYDIDQRPIVRRALISSLCGEMQPGQAPGPIRRAWNGLAQLAPDKTTSLDASHAAYLDIVGEFEAAREKGLVEFSAATNEQMTALGISGSAVRPNLNENEEWKQALARIRASFEPKVARLRDDLIQALL